MGFLRPSLELKKWRHKRYSLARKQDFTTWQESQVKMVTLDCFFSPARLLRASYQGRMFRATQSVQVPFRPNITSEAHDSEALQVFWGASSICLAAAAAAFHDTFP